MQVYQLHLQGMFLMKITRWTAFFIQNTRFSTQQRISTMIRTFIPNIPYRKISMNFNITFCVSLWYLRIYPVEKCAHFWQFIFHPFWGTVTLHFLQWYQWTTCKLTNIYKDIIVYENLHHCFICFMWRQAVQHLLLFQFAISHGPHISVQCTAVNIHCPSEFYKISKSIRYV